MPTANSPGQCYAELAFFLISSGSRNYFRAVLISPTTIKQHSQNLSKCLRTTVLNAQVPRSNDVQVTAASTQVQSDSQADVPQFRPTVDHHTGYTAPRQPATEHDVTGSRHQQQPEVRQVRVDTAGTVPRTKSFRNTRTSPFICS